jgi:hypothetical protein
LGLIIAHFTVGMPRVPDTENLVGGLIVDCPWLVAGLIAWRLRPDTDVGALMVAVGLSYAWVPLFSAAGPGAIPTWIMALFSASSVAILAHLILAFPSGVLEAALGSWRPRATSPRWASSR